MLKQAKIYQQLGHVIEYHRLMQAAGESVSFPEVSVFHQSLEFLAVEFIALQINYHRHLADTTHQLTKSDENHIGEYFVAFLNLLDQIYGYWITKVLQQSGNVYFPMYTSKKALEETAKKQKIWATNAGDLGINKDRALFAAFEDTQAYKQTKGLPWGPYIRALANTNKHLKLSSQSLSESVSVACFGSYRRMRTQILIESPGGKLYAWSFTPIRPIKKATKVYEKLIEVGFINQNQQVYQPGKSCHLLIRELIVAKVSQQPIEPIIDKIANTLNKDVALTTDQAHQIASLLGDKALFSAGFIIRSEQRITIRPFIEQALKDTRAWLEALSKSEKITLRAASPLPSLPCSTSMNPLDTEPETQSAAEKLAEYCRKHYLYNESHQLRQRFPRLLKFPRPAGDSDNYAQLSSIVRSTQALLYIPPFTARAHSVHRITQACIKLRQLIDQVFDRTVNTLIYVPNGVSDPCPHLKPYAVKSIDALNTILRKRKSLYDASFSEFLGLDEHYPNLYQALQKLQPCDQLGRWWPKLIALTNYAKHEAHLQLTDSGQLTIPGVSVKALDFLNDATAAVRCWVEACGIAVDQRKQLLKIAREGGDLSKCSPPYDRRDVGGNTPLHWACQRGDKGQVKFLLQHPQSVQRSQRKNHKGETPLSLAKQGRHSECVTMLQSR